MSRCVDSSQALAENNSSAGCRSTTVSHSTRSSSTLSRRASRVGARHAESGHAMVGDCWSDVTVGNGLAVELCWSVARGRRSRTDRITLLTLWVRRQVILANDQFGATREDERRPWVRLYAD